MKLFKRNQSLKKPEEEQINNKILNESELEPYPYTPTLDAEDIVLDTDDKIEGRYVNNCSQSFTVMTGKDNNSLSTINNKSENKDRFFNEIQQREVNNKNTSFVVRDSQLYNEDISSIHGDMGPYDDIESTIDNNTTITNNNANTKTSTQFTSSKLEKTMKEEISESTTNYQNSTGTDYTNLKTQSIYATPIFSGFLYKLGRNKRWQWRMFCFDGMSLACLSSKCKPKYVIPLEKIESIKLLHRNAPEYKPNTFVITVEKNDCKGKMDEGFFPYSEPSISENPMRPKRTFSMGYYSYLLRAKTSVDLERWMFVLLTMYGVMKREKQMMANNFTISNSPPQPYFSYISNSNQMNTPFFSRNENSYRDRVNNYYDDTNSRSNNNRYDDYSDDEFFSRSYDKRDSYDSRDSYDKPDSYDSRDSYDKPDSYDSRDNYDNKPDSYDSHDNYNNNNNDSYQDLKSPTSDSLRQIKIPSLTFAPPLSTMITSQYKDTLNSKSPNNSKNSSKSNSNNNSNNNLASIKSNPVKGTAVNNYSNNNAKDNKVEIISAQRYRDPSYNPVNYTSDLSNLRIESKRNKGDKRNKQTFNNPYVTSSSNNNNNNNNNNNMRSNPALQQQQQQQKMSPFVSPKRNSSKSPRTSPKSGRAGIRNGRESVIVSTIMEDFIFNDFDKNVEIDESLKEYAVQSLRLFSLAEQKAVVENVQQAWNLGREEDDEMLDVLVQELRKTPVKIDNVRESVVSQMAKVEIMDDDEMTSPNGNPNDNTFVSFAVDINDDEDIEDENSKIYRNRSTGHINKRNGSRSPPSGSSTPKQSNKKQMNKRSSTYVQKAWRNSIASLLNLDNELNVSLGSNFCPTLPRKSGELRSKQRTSSLPSEKFSKIGTDDYNKNLGRGENNSIQPRMVNNTRLATVNTLNRNRGKAIYLVDIAEESDSDDSDSEEDDYERPVRKDSMNPNGNTPAKKNRMSYIPRGRPFSYYMGKK